MRFEKLHENLKRELKTVTASHEQLNAELRWIVEHITGQKLEYWILQPDVELNFAHEKTILAALEKRVVKRLPIQYVLGEAVFYGLEMRVTQDVLIPRPETELLVDKTLSWLKASTPDKPLILDLATGSGCIGLAIKKNYPKANIVASDISRKALAVAKGNSQLLGLSIHYQYSNWFRSISRLHQFDAIVCNPPYIGLNEKNELDPEVLAEPDLALFVPAKILPTLLYLDIIVNAYGYLKDKAILVLELGDTVAEGVKEALEKQQKEIKYSHWEIENDLAGKPRVLTLYKG